MSYDKQLTDKRPDHETARDRDARMDAAYRVDYVGLGCEGLSLLAVVSSCRDEFVAEFKAHWDAMQWKNDLDLELSLWEEQKFGQRLFAAAHKLLWYEAGVAIFGPRQRRTLGGTVQPGRTASLTPGLTSAERKDRMLAALDVVAEKRAMP